MNRPHLNGRSPGAGRRGDAAVISILVALLLLLGIGIAMYFYSSTQHAAEKREVQAKLSLLDETIATERKTISNKLSRYNQERANLVADAEAEYDEVKLLYRRASEAYRAQKNETVRAQSKVGSLERERKGLREQNTALTERIETVKQWKNLNGQDAGTSSNRTPPSTSGTTTGNSRRQESTRPISTLDERERRQEQDREPAPPPVVESAATKAQKIIDEMILKVGKEISERGLRATPDDSDTIMADGFLLHDLDKQLAGASKEERAAAAERVRLTILSVQQTVVMAGVKLKGLKRPKHKSQVLSELRAMFESLQDGS